MHAARIKFNQADRQKPAETLDYTRLNELHLDKNI